MKTLYTPLLIILLSTFHASSQPHFITAGQTQGMMVTDYVPDKYFHHNYSMDTEKRDTIDLNQDGISDLYLHYIKIGGSIVDIRVFDIYILNAAIELATSAYPPIFGICSPSVPFAPILYRNDTIYDQYQWNNQRVLVFVNQTGQGVPPCVAGNFSPGSENCYLIGRMLNPSDTMFFYIHILENTTSTHIADYAIEGPDSNIIISSINNISSSNISISPNPFTSFINITADKPFEYNISDYLGRVVLSGITDKTIATQALASGNYVLTIKNEEMVTVRKMVKY